MSLPNVNISPFKLIQETEVAQINEQLQEAKNEEKRAMLLIQSIPDDSDLTSWKDAGMEFIIKNNTFSNEEEKQLADKIKDQAYFVNYTHDRIKSFLQNGNSVLIHQGMEDMTAEKI
ncbi:MAG: hypothetical protein AAF242_17870, partial [Bacteroidota bacterium]